MTLKLPVLRTDGGDRRGPDLPQLLPESIGGPPQLGLPLYLGSAMRRSTLYGLLRIGFTEEAARFRDWLQNRWQDADGQGNGPLQLMYGIDGRAELTEETLDHLEGYRGSRPDCGDRQRGVRATATGHLRRADGSPSTSTTSARRAPRLRRLGTRLRRLVDWVWRQLETGRRGHLGSAGGRRHFRLLQVHVMGGAGPRPAAGRQALLPGGPDALAESPRRDLRGGDGPRMGRAAGGVRAVVWIGSPGRVEPAHAARVLHGSERPAYAQHTGRDPPAARSGRPGGRRSGLPLRSRSRPGRPGGPRGDLQHVLLLAGRGAHPRRAAPTRARAGRREAAPSSRCSATPTTSACTPSRRAPVARPWATIPRRSLTSP